MRRLIKRLLLSNVVSFSQTLFNSFKSRVIGNSGVVEADSCAVTTLSNLDARNLLQSATFVLAPSGYKSGVIYSQVPSNGNGDLTVTRATNATRVNSAGLIESVGANVPRLDYSLGGCPATLLEPQRTNLALHSQNYGDSSWIALGSTKVSTTQTDPSGGSTAVNVTWASGGSGYLYRNQTGLTIGTTYTITFYVRSDNGSSFRLYADSLNFSSSNFTATSTFQRFTFTYTATSTSGTFGFRADTSNSAANLIIAFAQFEQGSYATTYIPTTTATVTRLTDTFTCNNIYTNSLIGASGFTWLFEIKNNLSIKGDQTDNTKFYGMFIGNSSTAPTSAICIYNDNTTALLKLGTISGTVTTPRYTTAAASIKVAITYDGTTLNAWVNGTKQISAISFSATLSSFEHLAAVNTDVLKYIAQMALWNTILPDSQCASLTS